MKRLTRFVLAIILFSNLSCSNKEVNNDIFLQYLKETFNEKDIIDERMFVVLPCTACKGCNQSVYSIFTQQFIDDKDITLIICNPSDKKLLSLMLKANNVKYDSLSKMAEYDFGYGYPSCIIVKDNNVASKYTLTPDIIHWLAKFNPS